VFVQGWVGKPGRCRTQLLAGGGTEVQNETIGAIAIRISVVTYRALRCEAGEGVEKTEAAQEALPLCGFQSESERGGSGSERDCPAKLEIEVTRRVRIGERCKDGADLGGFGRKTLPPEAGSAVHDGPAAEKLNDAGDGFAAGGHENHFDQLPYRHFTHNDWGKGDAASGLIADFDADCARQGHEASSYTGRLTPLTAILREEIARQGPISFEHFMETALYHPEFGYYRRARDPFGREGDFFTASQMQPVFGLIMRRVVSSLATEMENPAEFSVVELGAGRKEMREAFSEWTYVGVETGIEMPERIRGVVFANEFFDALPVDVPGRRVEFDGERFVWIPAEGAWTEARSRDEAMIAEIARRLDEGFVLIIDYGYTEAERVRFPEGTLMSYRRHAASPEVLRDPGERDITAHVDFTALMLAAGMHGLKTVRFETLAQLILRAGESDEFKGILAGDAKRALQLKTLLYGMGETFRALTLRKERA
jgi:SAM-dependent MidA family methyltransferase